VKNRITKACRNCGADFSIPNCRDWREHYCSLACRTAFKLAQKETRKRSCETCGEEFYPRLGQIRDGCGRFCSNRCALPHVLSNRKPRPRQSDAQIKAKAREYYLRNKERYASYAKEYARQHPELLLARTKAYRAANPDKVREFAQSRSRRKFGRLPRGTVASLYKMQRGTCPVCRRALGNSYHTDHIVPLARGGKHEPGNIQLLCGPCNVRKSAKDPVVFMQERGYLL
jgi:5-methylcytosine-specific restriction endonuclease McrA